MNEPWEFVRRTGGAPATATGLQNWQRLGCCYMSSAYLSDPMRNWIVRELPRRRREWRSRFSMNMSKSPVTRSQSAPCTLQNTTSSSGASIASSNSGASPPDTRKPPELTFQCYASQQRNSGSKPSTRPNQRPLVHSSRQTTTGYVCVRLLGTDITGKASPCPFRNLNGIIQPPPRFAHG